MKSEGRGGGGAGQGVISDRWLITREDYKKGGYEW